MALLEIENLSIEFRSPGQPSVRAVDGFNLTLHAGQSFALVGESGSGKSATALSILRLLDTNLQAKVTGAIRFRGQDILTMSQPALRAFRSTAVSMISQEPLPAMNPLKTIGAQLDEALRIRRGGSHGERRARVLQLLESVLIPDPDTTIRRFPHTLSGGQLQRVMIAMALAKSPELLIADEPTTALDVSTQAEIIKLLNDIKARTGMAMLLISHDFSVVRKLAAKAAVMQRGRIVESGSVTDLFSHPREAYTRLLTESKISARPSPPPAVRRIVLAAKNIRVEFNANRRLGEPQRSVTAVDGVDLDVAQGETLGIVGESGSGKTSLTLALLKLIASSGSIQFEGEDIRAHTRAQMFHLRRRFQVVFQDPYSSLSPRMSVGEIVDEGLVIHNIAAAPQERASLVRQGLEEVGLSPDLAARFPNELSGGQRQRVAIARALALNPTLMVLDEPTSALDRALQRQVIDLLRTLQKRRSLAFILISHDLRVVKGLAHRTSVMRKGKIIESGLTSDVLSRPQTSYTQSLIDAAV